MLQRQICCEIEEDLAVLLDDCDLVLVRGEVHLGIDSNELIGGVCCCSLDNCIMSRVIELVKVVYCRCSFFYLGGGCRTAYRSCTIE